MDLKHLRSFIAVAEEVNFRKAAERLNLTQPPLSLQLKHLEERLGVKLLERGRNKKVTLTAAGKSFLEDARAVVHAADKAFRDARLRSEGRVGHIRIGFTDDFLFSRLPSVIARFSRRYPDVTVTHSMSISRELVRQLQSGELDIALVCLPIQRLDPRFVVAELPPIKIVAVLPEQHPHAHRDSVWLRELKDDPILLMPTEIFSGYSAHLARLYAHAEVTPKPIGFGQNSTMMVQIVAEGGGILLASETSIPPDWPGVRRLGLEDPRPYIDVGVIYSAENASRKIVENFRQLLDQSLRDQQPAK